MGAEIAVKGHTSNGATAPIGAVESYSVRDFSNPIFLALYSPAVKHDGHHTAPLNSTEQSWHTNRPQRLHAATARLPGRSKQVASPSAAASVATGPLGA